MDNNEALAIEKLMLRIRSNNVKHNEDLARKERLVKFSELKEEATEKIGHIQQIRKQLRATKQLLKDKRIS